MYSKQYKQCNYNVPGSYHPWKTMPLYMTVCMTLYVNTLCYKHCGQYDREREGVCVIVWVWLMCTMSCYYYTFYNSCKVYIIIRV